MRRWHSAALVGVAIAALAIGFVIEALAQNSVYQNGIFGNEAVQLESGGAGGSAIYTTAGRLSSGASYAYFSAAPSAFTIGSLAGTVNTAGVATGGALNINAAATAIAITFPPTSSLLDGEVISLCNTTTSAWSVTVTMTANSGQTVVAGADADQPADSCGQWIWQAGQATWYKTSN